MSKKKKYRREIAETVVLIIIAVVGSYAVFIGLEVGLGTYPESPLRAVSSGSMRPTYNVGDLLVIQNIPSDKLQVGDVIVFEVSTRSYDIVHRIIEIQYRSQDGKLYFRTKGDNNPAPDYWGGSECWNGMIPEENVIGKVIFSVPLIGYVSLAVSSEYGVLIIGAIILLIILISIPFGDQKTSDEEETITSNSDENN
ncbi:MAG: signal peptidase I [Promethearchaeota archaeon]